MEGLVCSTPLCQTNALCFLSFILFLFSSLCLYFCSSYVSFFSVFYSPFFTLPPPLPLPLAPPAYLDDEEDEDPFGDYALSKSRVAVDDEAHVRCLLVFAVVSCRAIT